MICTPETTLKEFLTEIYAPLRGIDERTILVYSMTIKPFGKFLGEKEGVGYREPRLCDLEELTVARFLAHRVRERAPATAAKDRSQLRALWEFAARRGIINTWPTIPLIKIPERVPEAWLTEEFERLLAEAQNEQVVLDGIPAGLWWKALLMVCYDTGERITSVMGLRWSGWLGTSVLFRAENRKGQRRDIVREISTQTADAMLAIRGDRGPDDFVFPWPRNRQYLWRRLGIILGRAKLPAGRKDKFHRIRKTTASYFEAAGHSAQRLLDHADPATTRAYLDPRIVKTTSAPDVIPRPRLTG